MTASLLPRFRKVAWMEGVSFLVLLGIAMPLKYFADMPMAVRVVGMAHGVLFIAYVVLVTLLAVRRTWNLDFALWALLMSFVPFGTFVLDRQIAKELAAKPSTAA